MPYSDLKFYYIAYLSLSNKNSCVHLCFFRKKTLLYAIKLYLFNYFKGLTNISKYLKSTYHHQMKEL